MNNGLSCCASALWFIHKNVLPAISAKRWLGAGLALCAATACQAQIKLGQNPTNLSAGANLQIEANSGAQLVVSKSTGNVGVGTATPATRLEVVAATAGSSGVRLTNLPSAPVLATNSNGDIVAASSTGTTLARCLCGEIKMNLSAWAGSTLPATNGSWQLMNGSQTSSGNCTVPTVDLTGKLLVMDAKPLQTISSATNLAQNQLPNVQVPLTLPYYPHYGSGGGYPVMETYMASGGAATLTSDSINGNQPQKPLNSSNLPRLSVNYYVCVTN